MQVGEIEEQLTTARRELAKSEEANQKLQRDVKEVGQRLSSHRERFKTKSRALCHATMVLLSSRLPSHLEGFPATMQ